jgi:phytoene synthase
MSTELAGADQPAVGAHVRGALLGRAYSHCEETLRAHDKDRYLADLFIPSPVRPHAHALHAFSHEIARLRDIVSEPMPGELRQQWWRDALERDPSAPHGEALANPVAAALFDTIARHSLSRQAFVGLIDARIFDLYDDPMPDLGSLEAYCRDTSSVLIRLVATMLSGAAREASGRPEASDEDESIAEAAAEAGIAYAYAGLIGTFARHAARGQLYLPGDILRRHGVSREAALGGEATPALIAAVADWRAEARRHAAAANVVIERLPPRLKPAFRPLALVEPSLRLTERRGYDPFNPPPGLSQWRRQWALWRG